MYVCMYTHICRYEYIHTYPEGMRAALQVSLFFRVFLHQVVLVFLVLTHVCVSVCVCVCVRACVRACAQVLVFFVLMGMPAGHMSARFAKLMRIDNQFQTAFLTGTLFPGVCFGIFFAVNTIAWGKQSSTAVPFGTLVVLMLLWFGVSLPLIFFGAFVGNRYVCVCV